MTAALSLEEVAEIVGLSYERFRKVWSRLPGFPQPFRRPLHGHGTYAWAPEPVLAWRDSRAPSIAVGDGPPRPANDGPVAERSAHRSAILRQRQDLARMMRRT